MLYNQIEKPEDAEQLQRDLDTLRNWEKTWLMEFNVEKCFVMKVTHSTNPSSHVYHLGQSNLQETSSHTYLGVEITKDLRWNQHVNKITATANRSLGFLRRNIPMCSKRTKARAFTSLVRPHLEYSCAVWDVYTQDLITQIEAVQRRGARFVFNDYNYTSSPTSMLAALDWVPLSLRRKEHRLNILQNSIHGHLAIPTRNILRPTSRSSRSSNKYSYQRLQPKKDCFKYSFFPRTITDWNQLPADIASLQDKTLFKNQLHKHLRK